MRAKLVKTLSELDRYRYCGHSVLMGRVKYEWQARDYVLKCFGNKEKEAVKSYREFAKGGMSEGKRPDLVGGGLIRSVGGWSEVVSMRRLGERRLVDERILGSGDFVKEILEEADERVREQFTPDERKDKVREVIEEICKRSGVSVRELRSGGRRHDVSQVRAEVALKLVGDYGITFAEVARNVGVSTSAIFNILQRRNN